MHADTDPGSGTMRSKDGTTGRANYISIMETNKFLDVSYYLFRYQLFLF